MSDPIGKTKRIEGQDWNAVLAFAGYMQAKLRDNSHKAHWSTVSQQWLLNRCMDEIRELQEALKSGRAYDIVSEAADVANFAMMIADNARMANGGKSEIGNMKDEFSITTQGEGN